MINIVRSCVNIASKIWPFVCTMVSELAVTIIVLLIITFTILSAVFIWPFIDTHMNVVSEKDAVHPHPYFAWRPIIDFGDMKWRNFRFYWLVTVYRRLQTSFASRTWSYGPVIRQ